MKNNDLWWVLTEIYGYSVILAGFITTLVTHFLSQFHDFHITVYTNNYGEYIIELYMMITGLTAFIVSAYRRFIRPRA